MGTIDEEKKKPIKPVKSKAKKLRKDKSTTVKK